VSNQGRLVGHVFISYVREDSLNVDRLQHLLQTAGVRVWRDTADLWPGEDWRIKIRQAITSNALVFLACFSHNSLGRERSYQNEELTLAIDQMRLRRPGEPWLIPIRFDDCDIPDISIGGGRSLGSIQRADLFGDRFTESSARLVEVVQRILQRHRGLTSSDAGNSAGETDPYYGGASSDDHTDDRPAEDMLSSVKSAFRNDSTLEMRGAIRVHVGWALWGKRPGSGEDYSVLDSSDEPFSRAEFGQILTHFTPGVPSAADRGPGALPWVTISRVGLSGDTYLGVTVQTATSTVDPVGRPIIQSSYFCVPFSDLTRTPISYTDLYNATAEIRLPSVHRNSIRVTLPCLNPEELASGIVNFGESAVATTAALLASGPVTVIRAENSTLQERLWFIEAVAALLPYGYRAGYTAATWSDSWYQHRIRLVFAEQPTQGVQSVIWREPSEHLADSLIAQEFLAQLGRLRRRYSGVNGLSVIIDRLAKDTEPRRFEQAQPVISSLFQMEMIDAYVEGSETQLSVASSPPQVFAGRTPSTPGRPEAPHAANAHTEPTAALDTQMNVGRSEVAAHAEESAHLQAQARQMPLRAAEGEGELRQATDPVSRTLEQFRAADTKASSPYSVPAESTAEKSAPRSVDGSIDAEERHEYDNPIKKENQPGRLAALNLPSPSEVMEPLSRGIIEHISLIFASTLFSGLGLSVAGYAITKAIWRTSSVNWTRISDGDIAGLVIWGILSVIVLIVIAIRADRSPRERVFAIAWNLMICSFGILIAL
jgi:hypothetical protein